MTTERQRWQQQLLFILLEADQNQARKAIHEFMAASMDGAVIIHLHKHWSNLMSELLALVDNGSSLVVQVELARSG